MKRKISKIIINTVVIGMLLTTALPTSAEVKFSPCNPSISDSMSELNEIDDKNMHYRYGYGKDNYKTYYGQTTSGHSVIFLNNIFYDRFEFVLKDNNYEAVKEHLLEIILEYYPVSYVQIEVEGLSIYGGKDENISFTIGDIHSSNCGEAVGRVIFAPNNSTSVSDENKEKMKAIMQKLNEENLISKFYEAGQISRGSMYYVDDFGKSNFYEYLAEGIDVKALQTYIDENNLNCIMQPYVNEDDYMLYYRLVPNKEMEFDEYFNIVTNIYENLNYKPGISFIDTNTYYYETNSLEMVSSESEIILGDVNGSGNVDVRDVSFIAGKIAGGKAAELPNSADYNKDSKVNVRDAAAIARDLAKKSK